MPAFYTYSPNKRLIVILNLLFASRYVFIIVQFVDEHTAFDPINTSGRKQFARVAFMLSIT